MKIRRHQEEQEKLWTLVLKLDVRVELYHSFFFVLVNVQH